MRCASRGCKPKLPAVLHVNGMGEVDVLCIYCMIMHHMNPYLELLSQDPETVESELRKRGDEVVDVCGEVLQNLPCEGWPQPIKEHCESYYSCTHVGQI